MKRKSNSKSNTNPNRKSKTFLLREERDGAWVVRRTVLSRQRRSVGTRALDNAAVVIDRMTGSYLFLKSHSL